MHEWDHQEHGPEHSRSGIMQHQLLNLTANISHKIKKGMLLTLRSNVPKQNEETGTRITSKAN